MIDPTLPPSLASMLRELERRLSNLERSPGLPYSSIRGGALRFLDEAGVTRWQVGNVPFSATVAAAGGSAGSSDGEESVSGGYGVAQFDENGAMIAGQITGHRGALYPGQLIPLHRPDAVSVTSGSWTNCFEGRVNRPVGDVVAVGGAIQSDAGTTGEVRITAWGASTSALAIPASANRFGKFDWLHPGTTGIGDPRTGRDVNLFLVYEARRTGGTGALGISPPQIAEITSSWLVPGATVAGNPRFL